MTTAAIRYMLEKLANLYGQQGSGIKQWSKLWLCVFTVIFLCFGCAARVQHVTDLPPGVTEQQVKDWDAEVAALHKIAAATSSIRQSVIDLHNAGAFPDSPTYIKVLQSIGKVDQLEQAAAEYLQQTPKTFGQPQKDKVKALVAQIGNELNDLANLNYFGTGTKARQYIGEALAAFNLALTLVIN